MCFFFLNYSVLYIVITQLLYFPEGNVERNTGYVCWKRTCFFLNYSVLYIVITRLLYFPFLKFKDVFLIHFDDEIRRNGFSQKIILFDMVQ
jgi:hypothetical protein